MFRKIAATCGQISLTITDISEGVYRLTGAWSDVEPRSVL